MEQKPPALKLENITVTLSGKKVLEDINLVLPQRELVGLIGPNGGGKTVLLKTMLGLIKPSSGSVEILGEKPKRSLKKVGYVPQFASFDADYPINVLEVVLMGRIDRLSSKTLRFCYSSADKEAALEALETVKLTENKDTPIGALSGGQVQRTLIARALAGEPELLLLDEPTSSLDPKLGVNFFDLLHNISKKMTVVLVSHDIGVIAEHVTSIACLNRKLHYHPSKEITEEMVEDTYGCPLELLTHGHHAHRVLKSHEPE